MKKIIIGIIIGVIICTGTVLGTNYLYKASEVSYKDTNVESAINELYKIQVSEYYFTVPTNSYDSDVYSYDKEGYYFLKQNNSNSISHLNSGDTWTITSTQHQSMIIYLGETNPFDN